MLLSSPWFVRVLSATHSHPFLLQDGSLSLVHACLDLTVNQAIQLLHDFDVVGLHEFDVANIAFEFAYFEHHLPQGGAFFYSHARAGIVAQVVHVADVVLVLVLNVALETADLFEQTLVDDLEPTHDGRVQFVFPILHLRV